MINEKKEMYVENSMNLSNAFEFLSKTEKLCFEGEKYDLAFKNIKV